MSTFEFYFLSVLLPVPLGGEKGSSCLCVVASCQVKLRQFSKATRIKPPFKLSEQPTYQVPRTGIQDDQIILVHDRQSKPD